MAKTPRKPSRVVMITAPANAMKRAFIKAHPSLTVEEVAPVWLKFWANLVRTADVTYVDAKPKTNGTGEADVALPFTKPEAETIAEPDAETMGAFEKIPQAE